MYFFLKTLGCRMNALDSARLRAGLTMADHSEAGTESEADTVIINTCTVTHGADRDSRHAARSSTRPDIDLFIFGCGPRVDPESWRKKFPGANTFGTADEVLAYFGVDGQDVELPTTSRTRLPIAIQQGCDNVCTFCITRIARGRHQSLPAEGIIRQIQRASEAGIQEVVLTGINLAAWGCKNSNQAKESKLGNLLLQILAETDIPRIRLSSLGPQFVHHAAFWQAFADPRICDYLHISLQSGSADVLQKMNRGHGLDEVRKLAHRARELRPQAAITADIIAGFPGETDMQHQECLAFIREIHFAKLHVFPFSPRAGTVAADLPGQLPAETKKQRAADIRTLGDQLRRAFLVAQLDTTQRVLVELDGTGLTTNYVKVKTDTMPPNTVQNIRISQEKLAESAM